MTGDHRKQAGGPARLLSVVGTRPEAIKIAPLAIAAAPRSGLSHRILATGQHGETFTAALADFGLIADRAIPPVDRDPAPDVMVRRFAAALAPVLAAERPDMVLVQGDTTSAYAAALAADAQGIPVCHVEAGCARSTSRSRGRRSATVSRSIASPGCCSRPPSRRPSTCVTMPTLPEMF